MTSITFLVCCIFCTFVQGGVLALYMNLEYPDLAKGMVLIAPAVVPNPETFTPVKVSSR